MKKLNAYFLIFALVFAFSCKKDDHDHAHESELITTLRYTLVPASGGEPIVLTFKDLDGDGGNAPVITSGILAANTVYNGSLELLNESKTPSVNITTEIQTESTAHQFFFVVTGANFAVKYTDQDTKGKPLGLKSQLTTQQASTGKLQIVLRHEPNKDATDVANGVITNAGGETDIQVSFDVTIR